MWELMERGCPVPSAFSLSNPAKQHFAQSTVARRLKCHCFSSHDWRTWGNGDNMEKQDIFCFKLIPTEINMLLLEFSCLAKTLIYHNWERSVYMCVCILHLYNSALINFRRTQKPFKLPSSLSLPRNIKQMGMF